MMMASQTINFLIEQQDIRELRAWYIRDLANFLRVESGILEKKIDEYLREHSWLSWDECYWYLRTRAAWGLGMPEEKK